MGLDVLQRETKRSFDHRALQRGLGHGIVGFCVQNDMSRWSMVLVGLGTSPARQKSCSGPSCEESVACMPMEDLYSLFRPLFGSPCAVAPRVRGARGGGRIILLVLNVA